MKGILSPLLLIGLVGAGCASHERVYYSRPANQPVIVQTPVVTAPVVTTTPPVTVVVPAITEQQAMEIARAEAYHHGWRNVHVQRASYLGDRWHVDVFNEPHHHVETYGWADVAPDGSVLAFSTSPDRTYSEYRRR